MRIEDWSGTSAESVSKKTKQPSSKTKVESADEERKNWSEYFFFSDCEDRGLEFWGLVDSGTSAKSVSKKTKQPSSKTKVESVDKERKNWSEIYIFFFFQTVRTED